MSCVSQRLRCPSKRSITVMWSAIALPAILWTAGCSARSEPVPQAGYERGGVPEFAGVRVIVLPVQRRAEAHADLDRELEFALKQLGEEVAWLFPADLEATIARNPGTGIQIDALPVEGFLVAELQRVGDPLFGTLYRLGALTDAAFGLLPIEASPNRSNEGVSLQLSAALLDLRRGHVLWFGIVEGGSGTEGELVISATAADALARRIVR